MRKLIVDNSREDYLTMLEKQYNTPYDIDKRQNR